MKAYELRKKLFTEGELQDWEKGVADLVLCAYSDSHNDLDEERNLRFFCINPVHGSTAIKISEKCIVSYNEFNRIAMEKVVSYFGEDSCYFFARECSVCLYVRPIHKCIHFNGKEQLACGHDEFSYDPDLQLFRIWWD